MCPAPVGCFSTPPPHCHGSRGRPARRSRHCPGFCVIQPYNFHQERINEPTIVQSVAPSPAEPWSRAVTLALLEAGAKVSVTYRKNEEFAALQSAAAANAARLDGYVTDVTDESAVAQLIEKILSKHGRLDALINTVGGFTGGQKFWEADSKSLDQMINLNLRSGWLLARAAVKPMLKTNRGVIVNIASRRRRSPPLPPTASKAAAVAMIDSSPPILGTGVRANPSFPASSTPKSIERRRCWPIFQVAQARRNRESGCFCVARMRD